MSNQPFRMLKAIFRYEGVTIASFRIVETPFRIGNSVQLMSQVLRREKLKERLWN